MTWTCEFDDGTTDTKTVAGGGAWLLDETGSVDGGVIAGDRHAPIPDCHLNDFPECDYHWSFTPAP